jgi:hypothetical protein
MLLSLLVGCVKGAIGTVAITVIVIVLASAFV